MVSSLDPGKVCLPRRSWLTTAIVSFHQQIVTPFSQLPLPITHQTVLILQQYLELSPTADEIFYAWNVAQEVSWFNPVKLTGRARMSDLQRVQLCCCPRSSVS